MSPSIGERHARPEYQVLDDPRREDLAGLSHRREANGDVDGPAGDSVGGDLDLAGVDAGAERVATRAGGGGSIARWLADRTGPAGGVVVTDINPRWLDADRPNIEMRRHDIVADELEQGAFDLAHERLVLIHLPERRQALERMIGAVKPGGWLLIEDFDRAWLPLTPDCEPANARLFTKVMNAFAQILVEAGVDVDLGRRLCSLLREQGMSDVQVESHARVCAGGSPGCRLHRSNIEQLEDRVTDIGHITPAEIERFYELIEDPSFSVNSYMLVSARGRRPRID